MVGLALVSTALAYLIFFQLIRDVGPVRTFTVTYVIPVFGVLWGAVFLHEQLTLGVLAGLGCILASLVVVHGRSRCLGIAVQRLPVAPAAIGCMAESTARGGRT